jgi:flagellar biogenesis protein FliO
MPLAQNLLGIFASRGFSLPFQFRKSSKQSLLRSIGRLPLTPQHSLHLVEVGSRQVLVGVSPSGIAILDAPSQFHETLAAAAREELR